MCWRTYIVILGVVMAAGSSGWAQRTGPNWPNPPTGAEQRPQIRPPRKADLERLELAAEQHKMRVQKDAERLSQLVSEFRQTLDRTPAGTLSVDAVKKSKEVEKLAKRVRKEMESN